MTGVSYEVVDGVVTSDPLMRNEPGAMALAHQLYTEHKAGPFAIIGMQPHAFMPTPEATTSLGYSTGFPKPRHLESRSIATPT